MADAQIIGSSLTFALIALHLVFIFSCCSIRQTRRAPPAAGYNATLQPSLMLCSSMSPPLLVGRLFLDSSIRQFRVSLSC
ncbi:uncharacterized protein F5891DRAFT_1010322 [Suillus fuscotomentosus]|uniref:Uncharacterized protein n=1 Tax=Suillus fuscotomentosus TaxID=1912939 RepID=A0AAD4HP87_9AGAM|nr:uncharacterized protein F5891DRAFT_1010322 [Suillus fuscotomentosus]KAG1905025.1 hypothetical protein F5891DRAFT_1010322 [Suillus fuscotomentosus]